MSNTESSAAGVRAAYRVIEELQAEALSHGDAPKYWQAFVHTLLGGLVNDLGEEEILTMLQDALVVLPIAAAAARGETGKH